MKNCVLGSLLLFCLHGGYAQKKVLIVASNIAIVNKQVNGTYLVEIAVPFSYFTERGVEVDLLSPKGGPVALYHKGDTTTALKNITNSPLFINKTKTSFSPAQVKPGAYSAIVFPGGYGHFWDVFTDRKIASIAAEIYESGGAIGALGHGTADLIPLKLRSGQALVKDVTLTCFPSWVEKERMTEADFGKLLPVDMEKELREKGAKLRVCSRERQEMADMFVVDAVHRIVTASFADGGEFVAREVLGLIDPARVPAALPEKIYGKNKVLRSNEYYLEQMTLWKKETLKDPSNSDGWFNYYRASRNAYVVGQEQDSFNLKGINRFARLKKIVDDMEKQVPLSFEYNYVRWLNGNNDQASFPYLEKAFTLGPGKAEPLLSLAGYYETIGDQENMIRFAKQYYRTGDFSPGLLNFAYNVLAGLEKNAIVFTEGDKDTEAIFLLQSARGVRTDVTLVNLNLLQNRAYRERVMNKLQLPLFGPDPLLDAERYELYKKGIISAFAANKESRPVYIAVTVSDAYTAPVENKLHLTGLTWLYSDAKPDAAAQLKRNYEERYATDYLKMYLPYDITVEMLNRFNQHYLISLAALCKDYRASGNTSKAAYYQDIARKIAADYGSFHEYNRYFKP